LNVFFHRGESGAPTPIRGQGGGCARERRLTDERKVHFVEVAPKVHFVEVAPKVHFVEVAPKVHFVEVAPAPGELQLL
jgi:hypothetical protein